ncbi:hypothetical protein V8G54_025857 [Vigna mungo]|uniref:Aminotransferase class I/classII large domain-containing protein n=1 Tax=Vigna mungo TaxID=3915 RepID=A0AAQ3MZ67_VIGMU
MAENPSDWWDSWVEEALTTLHSLKVLRSLRPICLRSCSLQFGLRGTAFQVFDEMQHWDRSSVEVEIAESTFSRWMHDTPSAGDEIVCSAVGADDEAGASYEKFKKLILFSGNDYLGLSSHPTIGEAVAKLEFVAIVFLLVNQAAQEHGMGPRGSALICGYTNYHRLLESSLADLKKKEDCLLCPTGFAANMAVMTAIGSIGTLLAGNSVPSEDEKIAVFSDALNHASIIDGIRLVERQKSVKAHGTFVCGKNGGGVAEEFNCEKDVDICIGTLSKAAGCHGGFIACSKKLKLLIQSRGRSFIFSTSAPVPIAAAAHAAVEVAKLETWRREAIWSRVKDFHLLTGIPVTSHIISLIVGSEDKALQASRYLLQSGFHVTAIRPPTVPPNSCRLRVALSAVHTRQDVENLAAALSRCINFQDTRIYGCNGYARL